MNGLQALVLLIAVIFAATLGTIMYSQNGEAAPELPKKGTYSMTGGSEVAFDGLKARATTVSDGNKVVVYSDGAAGTSTIVNYQAFSSKWVPEGEKASDYSYYMSHETITDDTGSSASSDGASSGGVTGELIANVNGVKTYRYAVGSESIDITFDAEGSVSKYGDEAVTFSPTVSGSLDFDLAAEQANVAVVEARVNAVIAKGRQLGQTHDRKLGWCGWGNALSAVSAYRKSGGTYGNYCGKGTANLCAKNEKPVANKGWHSASVCDDAGADAACSKHDSSSYGEDVFGMATLNWCKVDKEFESARNTNAIKSSSFSDGQLTESHFLTATNCLFGVMPCINYEHTWRYKWMSSRKCVWRACWNVPYLGREYYWGNVKHATGWPSSYKCKMSGSGLTSDQCYKDSAPPIK